MAKGWGWKLADLMLNLYSKGLLGGQPKEMLNLYEEGLRGKVEAGKAGAALGQKPMWTAGPTPAPGEGVAAGGIIPPDYKEGPTYGEAEALDLPGIWKTMIGAKGSMAFQSPVIEKLMGPTKLEEMGRQPPYLSGEEIKLQNYLQWKLLKAAQKLQQPKEIPPEGEEGEIGAEITPAPGREDVSYTSGVKDLTDALLKTAFGWREKEKQPTYGTISPGMGVLAKTGERAGEMVGVPVPKGKEKEPTKSDFKFFVDEYRKEHPKAKIGEIIKAWKAQKEPTGITPAQRELNTIRQDYFTEIHQYNSAKRGVGQFLEDPNKEMIAQESLDRAMRIADQYVEKGGDIRDLGIDVSEEMLPEGLTEELIQFYIDKHGMTKEEVIQRYMTKMSQ